MPLAGTQASEAPEPESSEAADPGEVVPVRVLEQYHAARKVRLWGSSKLPALHRSLRLAPLDLLVLGGPKNKRKA